MSVFSRRCITDLLIPMIEIPSNPFCLSSPTLISLTINGGCLFELANATRSRSWAIYPITSGGKLFSISIMMSGVSSTSSSSPSPIHSPASPHDNRKQPIHYLSYRYRTFLSPIWFSLILNISDIVSPSLNENDYSNCPSKQTHISSSNKLTTIISLILYYIHQLSIKWLSIHCEELRFLEYDICYAWLCVHSVFEEV